jgi:NhaP-type Na+/H+ or K+/H+ antiporter
VNPIELLAIVQAKEFLFLPPICLAIALVTSAAHRESMRDILSHAWRAWIVLMVGMIAFALAISYLFEWLLPG